MRILLIGEYSNVHWTLARGLKALGEDVTVLSNGDFWKDYPRDISLVRSPGKWGGVRYMARLISLLPRLRGYDIVQIINPMFLEIKAGRILPIYRYLRKHNKRVVMGAFGMDYYWVHTCDTAMPLRYSDFNIGRELRHNADAEKERRDWIGTPKERLNKLIAADCDAIVAGLYEYWVCYHPAFPLKTTFIPYPIELPDEADCSPLQVRDGKLRVFVGISKKRSEYKGTDIMLSAAREVLARHPESMELGVANGVPFAEYSKMMTGSDAILDQLYSYTPSMNSLLAMSKRIVCVGGGEPEGYALMGKGCPRPIVNVVPDRQDVVTKLEHMVTHQDEVAGLKRLSREYVRRYHDYVKVARQYQMLYRSLLK